MELARSTERLGGIPPRAQSPISAFMLHVVLCLSRHARCPQGPCAEATPEELKFAIASLSGISIVIFHFRGQVLQRMHRMCRAQGAQASLVARASGTDPLAEQGLSFFTYLALIGHLGKTQHT